jgi:hypothetical protein
MAPSTGADTETRALASNDESNPVQLPYIVSVDHRGTRDGSRTYCGPIVNAEATERKRWLLLGVLP